MTGALTALSTASSVAPQRAIAETHPAPPLTPPASASATASQAGLPNPTLHLDPALGLVVLQFRDGMPGAAMSIPTRQQLAAYQSGSAAPPGQHRTDHRTA